MKTLRLLATFALSALPLMRAADAAAQRWTQYEPSFKAFAEQDAAKPFPKGGILFVGSSIFRQWTTVADQMAPLPVLNRAFGGSRTGDQLARFDQLVPRYAPRIVVYYCGSNDLNAKDADTPPVIFARFKEFSDRVRRWSPETRVVYVTSTRSPDRVLKWEQVDHFNALVRAHCAATPHHHFIDINPALVDDNGHPRLDLYQKDKLHFHPPAYEGFTVVIRPVLERLWAEVNAAK